MSAPSDLAGRSVLITGASGFVGSHIVLAALAAGASVRAAVRSIEDRPRIGDVAEKVSIELLDMTDPEGMGRLLRKNPPAVVIHAAAYGVDPAHKDPEEAFRVNVAGTWALLKACADSRVERFIHIGTCFEYGPQGSSVSEDAPLFPLTSDAASKAAGSLLVAHMSRSLGVRAVVLRPFWVWGPGERADRLAPQILRSSLDKKRLALSEGRQVLDFIYVKDAVDWVVRVAGHPEFDRYPFVNIATGHGTSVRDFARQAAEALGSSDLLDFGRLPVRETDYPRVVADVKRLKDLIGPLEPTSVAAGMLEMRDSPTKERGLGETGGPKGGGP